MEEQQNLQNTYEGLATFEELQKWFSKRKPNHVFIAKELWKNLEINSSPKLRLKGEKWDGITIHLT